MPPKKADPPEESPKPRLRWKRWIFGCLLVGAAFLVWFNGPGIRWSAKKLILQQLETQKLSGTFEVTGTALKGLAIHKLSLTGESKIQSVESDLLKLEWTPSSLFKKRVNSLSLEKLHLVIDPEAPALPKKENDPSKDKEKKSLSESLNLVRNLIRPSDISLTDLRVEIIDKTTVSLDALKHSPDSDIYTFEDLRTKDHLDRAIHNPLSTLTWTEPGFALDQVSVLPKLSLQNLIFHPDEKASGELLINNQAITFSSDFQSHHRIILDSPPLDISTIVELINPDLVKEKDLNGKITALEIDSSQGLVNLQASDLEWDGQKLASATIQARTPDFLSPFDQEIEVQANLDNRLIIDGTISPSSELLDSSADLTFTIRDPAIPDITGDLTYQARKAHLEASSLKDLRFKATYFADSSTYEANADSQLQDASQLDPKLTGPLTFTLSAKGDLKEKTHSGILNLDRIQLDQPKLANTTTQGIVTYDWPRKVAITDLTITSPEGQLQGDLQWQDDILTISKLDLVDDNETLLSATAELPAPLKTKSLDDFLQSTEPLSLQIKSQPLTFEKLSSFLPIPQDLSGVLLADLNLSGSLAEPALNGFATLDDFRIASQPDLPPVDLELNFETIDQKLLFTTISSEPNGPLLNVDGSLPFTPRVWIENKTNPDKHTPIDLHIYSPKLDLQRLNTVPNLPDQLTGILETDITLSGSLAEPTLDGFLNLDSFRLASQPELPPLNLDLNFKTVDQKFLLTAKATEPNSPLLNLDANFAFLPQIWLKDKRHPEDSPIDLRLSSPNLDLELFNQIPGFPKELSGIFKTDLTLTGSLAKPKLDGFLNLASFRSNQQDSLPPIDLDLRFATEEQNLLLAAKASEPNGPLLIFDSTLAFVPDFWIKNKKHPEDSPIDLRLTSPNLQLELFHQIPGFPQELDGIFRTDLTLTGSLAKPSLDGFLKLDSFRSTSQPSLPSIALDLNFKTVDQELLLSAKANEPNGPLFSLDGKLPFLPEVWLKNKKHPEDSPINLRLTSPNLNLKLFNQIPGLPEELDGILQTDLTLTGSLAQPSLDGFLKLDSFRLQNQPDLSPVDFNLNLRTENQQLLLTADSSDPNGPLFNVTGNIPFLPKAWIERKVNPNDSPLNIRATSPDLDLRRIQPFAPTIKQINGQAQLDLLITGTISAPKFSGSAKANIANMRLSKSPMSTFRNTNLNATFQDDTVTIQPSNISASGGTATVSGSINLAGTSPIFDIDLVGKHVLLHRTQDYSFRGHPKLKLSGPYTDAKVSGSVQITESLIYKDLEILPFGVPRTTEIPQPKIPTFSRKETADRIAKSDKGVLGWDLDIDVTTADPILIRGNLARGEVTGDVKVTGTIGDPKTNGTVTSSELELDLPFSNLDVQSGLVTLRPKSLTDPLIDLRGSSVIGQYTVQVYLTGPVQNPTLILTSDPPMPESEIMLLLATGSASTQLEDRQVASQKALQYLVEGLRRRNRGKDKSLFQRLLKNSDQIELSLGDTNQFSGRKFSSATLEIDDQWDFTTQIDEAGQTRALVLFSVRLK